MHPLSTGEWYEEKTAKMEMGEGARNLISGCAAVLDLTHAQHVLSKSFCGARHLVPPSCPLILWTLGLSEDI